MKKITSVLLCAIMIFASFSCVPAYAEGASVQLSTALAPSLMEGELASVTCEISNSGASVSACIELYIDGNRIEGGCENFVLSSQCSENFDFTVPSGLDTEFLHTLLVLLRYGSGSELYSANIFTVQKTGEISMKFSSMPLGVTQGWALYYGVEFEAPKGKAFKVDASAFVRGENVAGTSKELIIKDGMQEIVYVNESYNQSDPSDFDFVYKINSSGKNPAFGEISISSRNEEIRKKITPVILPATISYRTNGYSYASLKGYVTTIEAGAQVEYLNPDNHNSMSAAKVKLASGLVCWVPMRAVNLTKQNFTIADTLTDFEREVFVNASGYSSKTPYLIWVNKQRQRLTVFLDSKGNWRAINTFPVATGKNATPTPTVVCEYIYKTRWVTDEYICDPVLALYDGYAIHNQPESHSGRVIDSTMGNPASAGCIRMLKEDVSWVHYYVPVGTTVVLY
ncbi:MAG: L,D-transpeptidase [Clostridia bacterium]|nr:L,D-transpeptidase [Clostridia bacterium]